MNFMVYLIIIALLVVTQGSSRPAPHQVSPADKQWCVARPGTPAWLLQSNLNYSCGFVDCGDDQCFLISSTSLFERVSLAMDISAAMSRQFRNIDDCPYYDKSLLGGCCEFADINIVRIYILCI